MSKGYRESSVFLIKAIPRPSSSCRLYCIFIASSLPTKLSVPLLEQVNLHFPGELVLLPPDSFLPPLGDIPSFTNMQATSHKACCDISYKELEQYCVTWITRKFD